MWVKKRIFRNEWHFRDMWDIIKHTNIWIMEDPKAEEKKEQKYLNK